MREKKGFTLIEVLISMAIFGVLIGIASIYARDWVDRYKAAGQTRQMYADLMNARVSAMQKNRIFFVTLAANQYAIYQDTNPGPDGDGILDGLDTRVLQTTTQYALASSPATAGFNFAANGTAYAGTIDLSDGSKFIDIQVISTADPATNCIRLTFTKILMGKWNGSTSACVAQ